MRLVLHQFLREKYHPRLNHKTDEMAVKTVVVLSACLALAIGAAIDPRAKRQADEEQSAPSGSSIPDASSLASGAKSGSELASQFQNALPSASGFGNMANSAVGTFTNAAKGIAGRLQNAANATIQEEKNSVMNSVNSVKDQVGQSIKTGANLAKTAFDLGTVFPKFGKNLIGM